jgi:phosphonate transport system permease protein
VDQYRFRRLLFDSLNFSFVVMVLFILIQGPTEEQIIAKISFYAGLAFALVLVGIGLSEVLLKKGFRTLGEIVFAPPIRKHKGTPLPFLGSLWGTQFLFSLLITLWVGVLVTKTDLWEILDERGIAGALKLFEALFDPNWTVLPQAILNVVVTIFMAFIATAFAIPIAFVLSFLCAKNIMRHPVAMSVYFFLRTLLNFVRSIEALIWAIIFSVWVGIGPFAGMLALMIHSIASLAKQYSEMVESVSEGPIEGVQSTGAGSFQTIWFAIVPQVILPYISFTVYRWDTNVRMATIIGFVGGGGIGTMLLKYQGQAMWNEVGTIVIVIAVVVWAMDQASALIRDALK